MTAIEESTLAQAVDGANAPGEQTDSQEEDGKPNTAAMETELKRARADAAKYRTQLRKLEEAEETKKRDEMTEVERLRADLAKAQAQAEQAELKARRETIRNSITAAATQAGAQNPQLITRLLEGSEWELSADGIVTGLDEAVKELAKTDPYLFRGKAASISPTNPVGGAVRPTDEEKRRNLLTGGAGRNTPFWSTGTVILPKDD